MMVISYTLLYNINEMIQLNSTQRVVATDAATDDATDDATPCY
jgi:hypothetical protein